MTDLSEELAGMRIDMRNAQFSFPLPAERIAAIKGGDIDPIVFDFDKAAA